MGEQQTSRGRRVGTVFARTWCAARQTDTLRAGTVPLFEDARITWAAEQFGGFAEKTVRELGPLEGAHTTMLERLGATSITAIEVAPTSSASS